MNNLHSNLTYLLYLQGAETMLKYNQQRSNCISFSLDLNRLFKKSITYRFIYITLQLILRGSP
jgi:hypothetical protein